MIKDYIQNHKNDGRYVDVSESRAVNIFGWTDHTVSRHAILSHRKTYYTRENFSERLHSHEFYELVAYIGGDVEYTNEDLLYTPSNKCLSVIINRPGEEHTTRLLRDGIYERYVLYFDKEFLEFFGSFLPFLSFLDSLSGFALSFEKEAGERIVSFFEHALTETKKESPSSVQCAYSNILFAFSEISSKEGSSTEIKYIPENVLKIKSYVDSGCKDIKNVNAIAERFFYSREHLSRLFKKYFNVTLADYLAKRKCEESKALLIAGENIGDVCYICGFGSVPSFVRAFKKFYHMTPSEFSHNKIN